MGGLLNEIQASVAERTKCATARMLESLPEDDRRDLEQAFADPTIASATIVRVLRNRGHQVGTNGLGDHRRGRCRCV